ncbi:MAG: MoaD/ThiS family protein [Candidatus Fermentithermobacillus carboniphilus]|uniref:MoaD/ThiS family protein n=1 Tax=Candidatus Fermentithermobacillus carboniphilus TaxID=3085328 RepID=A0AAT9LAF2_9FIRM|nr:MAG: MoaD/ThiS family protein [Candidatus Fermentithermobacillus carboniphilus]
MKLKVKLFGDLIRYSPSGRDVFELEVPGFNGSDATVKELIRALGIPEGEVWIITVNGVQAQAERILTEGDEVMIFAPVMGG